MKHLRNIALILLAAWLVTLCGCQATRPNHQTGRPSNIDLSNEIVTLKEK